MTNAPRPVSFVACLLLLAVAVPCWGADWIVKRSRYTHDPNTHARVTQYSPIGPFYANDLPNYQKSGYRYSRSSLQVGPSADHLHVVEEWGRPIEPYGQWRYPYRPYSAPYQAWGPPYGGLNVGVGYYSPYGYAVPPVGAPGAGAAMGAGAMQGVGPGFGPGVGQGAVPGAGAGFGPGGFGPGYGGGFAPGVNGGYGGGFYPQNGWPQNNWTNPFGGPPGVDEYYPEAPRPSRLGPLGF